MVGSVRVTENGPVEISDLGLELGSGLELEMELASCFIKFKIVVAGEECPRGSSRSRRENVLQSICRHYFVIPVVLWCFPARCCRPLISFSCGCVASVREAARFRVEGLVESG